MKPARTKKGAWRHFKQRLGERYGIYNMTHDEWDALMKQTVKAHTRHFVGRSSNTKTWWLLNYKNGQILALYCSKVKGLLSCLPLSKLAKALEGNQSVRNYLGMASDNVMLRKFNEGFNPIRVNLSQKSKENDKTLVDVLTSSATVSLSEQGAEHAQTDRQAGAEEREQGAEAAQLPCGQKRSWFSALFGAAQAFFNKQLGRKAG